MKSQGKAISHLCAASTTKYNSGAVSLIWLEWKWKCLARAVLVGLVPQVKKWKISGSWVKSIPLFNHSLRFRNLSRSHLVLDIIAIFFVVRQGEPHVSLDIILRNSQTINVQQSQLVSTLTCSPHVSDVFGCLAKPFLC